MPLSGRVWAARSHCLKLDRDALLTFYDFPSEHWRHLRTTNPIESTFTTIRLRHRRTKRNGNQQAILVMMFKLAQSATINWRKLSTRAMSLSLLEGKVFTDGVLDLTHAA